MSSLNSAAYAQFQSIQGPTDPNLTHSLTQGYQPVSRIGEVVINCFGKKRPLKPPQNAAHEIDLTRTSLSGAQSIRSSLRSSLPRA